MKTPTSEPAPTPPSSSSDNEPSASDISSDEFNDNVLDELEETLDEDENFDDSGVDVDPNADIDSWFVGGDANESNDNDELDSDSIWTEPERRSDESEDDESATVSSEPAPVRDFANGATYE